MIICPSCRSEQMNGTLFCSECGSDLQSPSQPTYDLNIRDDADDEPYMRSEPIMPKPHRNQPSPSKSTMPPARPISPPVADSAVGRNPKLVSKRSFRLMVLNSGRLLECPDQENVIIGRSDAANGEMPDIDLNPDNGLELGVSRRHACLTFRDNKTYIADLGSTNRTFLNRQTLVKGQLYEIKDGDEVRLGNVILKILNGPAK